MHFEPHIVFFPPRQCASLLYGFDYGASLSSIFLDCHHERENADASGGCGTVDGVKLSIETSSCRLLASRVARSFGTGLLRSETT